MVFELIKKSSVKRLLALVTVLVICICAVPAVSAAPASFGDVKPEDWFYADVWQLTSSSAIAGYTDGTFKPQNRITRAEFIKILVSVERLTLTSGDYFADTVKHWSDSFVDTAVKNNIVLMEDFPDGFYPDAYLTRYELALFASRVIKQGGAGENLVFEDIADPAVDAAVKAGFINGYLINNKRYFRPENNTTRAEASAVLMRIFRTNKPADTADIADKYILHYAQIVNHDTPADMYKVFEVVTRRNAVKFNIRTSVDSAQWLQRFFNLYMSMCERYIIGEIEYSYMEISRNLYEVEIFTGNTPSELNKKMNEINIGAERAIAVAIRDGMSEREMVIALNDYLVDNCAYDFENIRAGRIGKNSLTGYGVFYDRIAVCQGYSSAFNLMAKMLGIQSVTVPCYSPGTLMTAPTEDHMMNAVLIGGEILFVDTTWNDTGETDIYLLKTADQMRAYGYRWEAKWTAVELFEMIKN